MPTFARTGVIEYPHQQTGAAFLAERRVALLADEPGLGKAQPVNCMVATPTGWRRIGDLRPGDFVIGANGAPTRVLSVFLQGELPVYRVCFSDGASTRCSIEHLWAVNSHNRLTRGRNDWVVKTLQDILHPRDVRIKEPLVDRGGRRRWQTPVVAAVQFDAGVDLPLDPYVLGCLLGDGHTKRSSVSLCKPDMDMHMEVQRRLLLRLAVRFSFGAKDKCPTMNICGAETQTGRRSNPVLDALRQLGIQGCGSFTKFVPDVYLTVPASARLDLLRGLLDTDGTISEQTGGTVSFGSRSEALADAVLYLVRSLGGIGRKNTYFKVGFPFHQITVAMPRDVNPFFLKRKADKWKTRQKYFPARSMVSAIPDGVDVCVCIQVAASDGLYVTDDFIVTHNTKTTITAADLIGARKILVVCPGAVRNHWAVEFERWSAAGRPVAVVGGLVKQPPGDGVTVVSHATLSDAPALRPRAGRGGSIGNLLAGAPYDLLIVDESADFRQYNAQRTRTLFSGDGLASRCARTWCLSGTPFVNSAADLYPMVFGAIGSRVSWEDFCNHYCAMKPDAYLGVKPIGIRNAGELADGLRPFVLRRTIASLGIELPPLVVDRAPLAGVDPAAIGQAMAGLEGWTPERLAAALEQQDELRDSALARVRRALGIAKALPAAAHVESILASGEGPVVVFFQHTDVRRAMHAALAAGGRVCSWLDGTVTRAQLVAAVDWFQAGRIDVLLVQTQAGGTGLTLTRSHRAVVAELPWTATALFQAIKRVHRIGTTRTCTADVLQAPGCWLDEAMATVVEGKRRAADDLMDRLTSDS